MAYTGRAVTPKPVVKLGDWVAVEGRDYTLTYKDNVTVGKATVTITGKGNLKDSVTLEFEVNGGDQLDVAYAGHVQTYGDIPAVQNGASLGTVGHSKRMEAFWLKPGGLPPATGVEYQSHVQRQGWEAEWRSDGAISGTMGKSRRVETVRIRLTGESAEHLSVWYRVHSQTFGWSGWARDGQDAGTAGYSKRVESIEVVVLSRDAAAPGPTKNALRSR